MTKPAANTAVTVLPEAKAEELLLLVLNPTVHVDGYPATWLDPVKLTVFTAALACWAPIDRTRPHEKRPSAVLISH
jgi:hypothetical protein